MERVPTKYKWGEKCDLPVVPLGEVMLFRLPEVANDRHQALEERWSEGIWLGHARDTGETLVGRCFPWSEKGVGNKNIA